MDVTTRTALTRVALTAVAVATLDQLTKAWALARAEELSGPPPTIGLTLTWNRAIVFSLPVEGAWAWVLAAAVLTGVGTLLVRQLDWARPWSAVLAGAILGGALGNLIDRARFGAVVDFVKVGWWPVFNLADAALSCSVVALLLFGGRLTRRGSQLHLLQTR